MSPDNKESPNLTSEIESNDVEVLKAKNKELLKLLKFKDDQIEELNNEITILNSRLVYYTTPKITTPKTDVPENKVENEIAKLKSRLGIEVPNKPKIEIQIDPIDQISIWIQNPGLKHLSRQIFGNLDTKDLANCKIVSKTFNDFISNDKELLIKQFYQYKNFKRIHINSETGIKELVGNFESDFIGQIPQIYREDGFTMDTEKSKKIWIEWFGLLQTQDCKTLKKLWKEMSKRDSFWMDARLYCISKELYNLFENLNIMFPINNSDDMLIELLLEDSNVEGFSFILEYFEKCEINIPENFHFTLYRNFQDDFEDEDGNLKKMEILLEQSKINLDARNDYGKTMLEIATLNDDTKIVELCGKFQKI